MAASYTVGLPNGKAHDDCHLDSYWPGPDSLQRCLPICRQDMSHNQDIEINLKLLSVGYV